MRKYRLIVPLIISFIVLVFCSQGVFAQPKSKTKSAKAARSLKLTDAQKTAIKGIRADAAAQIKAVRADASLTKDAKKAKILAIRQAARKQIRSQLTPAQQKLFLKHRKKARINAARKLARFLKLTAEQRASIKAIMKDRHTQIVAVRKNASLSAEAKRDQIKAIRTATRAQFREVLTPEQREKLDAAKGKRFRKK
jgi:Spy/CpxP family protein refolding chaperone